MHFKVGNWRHEKVAIKIFSTSDKNSWMNEIEIYRIPMFNHKNILGFIAADMKLFKNNFQFWLITDYHENGSLYDFLNLNSVSPQTAILMALSIASGLCHLHMEIITNYFSKSHCETYKNFKNKPKISHCDLNSKNIFIKSNLTCAIGGLSSAIYQNDENNYKLPEKIENLRYLSPEIVNGTINLTNFDSFCYADIYSYGLILWEITRRCKINDKTENYQLPYFDVIQTNTNIDEIREVICIKKIRPIISNEWLKSDLLRSMSKIMCDCWYENASARVSALRIKKSLSGLNVNTP
ncbi:hypothetical protein PVAND_016048 [Polypedilum vanderplanki]|uniref:receptor protein serine/threonine kinase n=1 Tax=Polypedilum vanderplanki TaxID=319348 RepID=A0A9J6BEB6_POLVA|nr:hypothetical protein PVAND_016048 [Polypedilum vanderplanki]